METFIPVKPAEKAKIDAFLADLMAAQGRLNAALEMLGTVYDLTDAQYDPQRGGFVKPAPADEAGASVEGEE